MDLQMTAETILLQNPTVLNKQGLIRQANLLLKVPLDLKLAADFCNLDIRLSIARGCLNLNKRFIKAMTNFVVILDTTKVIISRIRRLIIKLHYQDELVKMMQQPPGTTGVETLYGGKEAAQYNYENIMDIDIPKRLKVVIEEGLTLTICENPKKLRPFLNGDRGSEEN